MSKKGREQKHAGSLQRTCFPYPTISLPVAVALFDLGAPVISDGEEEGGDANGISVHADQGKEPQEADQKA